MIAKSMGYWDQQTIEKIRKGYYSAVYFQRTREILLAEGNTKRVTMQLFQKQDGSVFCGVDYVIELLREGTGFYNGEKWVGKADELSVSSLANGDGLSFMETVMHIEGPYCYFAHLESLYLGILARSTKIATNVRKAVKAANGKPVLFFADRFDYFLTQELDGYAAKVGGAEAIVTTAQGLFWKQAARGTIPHAMIAVNEGSTIKAVSLFTKHYPDVPLIALVDFDNDSVRTSLEAARTFGKKLWGVRLDTSESIVDLSMTKLKNVKAKDVHGVTPLLVHAVRKALDKEGFLNTKIVVSGGFSEEKIRWFEKEKTPVDAYGVGSWLMEGRNDFTADIVRVDGKPMGKFGRTFVTNKRLKRVL